MGDKKSFRERGEKNMKTTTTKTKTTITTTTGKDIVSSSEKPIKLLQ